MGSIRPDWMDSKNPAPKCKDLNLPPKERTERFYPNNPSSEVAKAKALCNGSVRIVKDPVTNRKRRVVDLPCPFVIECLCHAIDEKEIHGVWGGTSERDRRKIWKARRRMKNPAIYNLEGVQFPGTVRVEIRKHG